MKLVIAGSRTLKINTVDMSHILTLFGLNRELKEIISGGAQGVDTIAEEMAKSRGYNITVMHADWEFYGLRAGPIRNAKMAVAGDALLLIWNGSSSGSRNMKEQMLKLKKPVYEIIIKDYNVVR